MTNNEPIIGFSKLSRDEKVAWLSATISNEKLPADLENFRMANADAQNLFESFSENTLSNYHLPWGIVPNVMIDKKLYHVPVVTEESSVVAAASKAASFWAERGGFRTIFISTIKRGQLHFLYHGDPENIRRNWKPLSEDLKNALHPITESMQKRGGGITGLQLKKIATLPTEYHQIVLEAKTVESMGANFINSVLEEMAGILPQLIEKHAAPGEVDIIMAILSNDTPDSIVKINLQCPVNRLTWSKDMQPEKFAERMKWATEIALHDKGRAVTHNKGIYNGVDAVVLATGNDFRAVEAAGHAFAVKSGKYKGLSKVSVEDNQFSMELEIPLALGTVGGLTKLHPLAAKSMEILGNPDVKTLMKIAATMGLASNFAALASLVTTGIQKGHMKMHLKNILNSLDVKPQHHHTVEEHFKNRVVSVSAVKEFLLTIKL
jgi:hydroxymethylglutaryl-CoA reductase